MKRFNEVIKVEVSIDAIADKLLNEFAEDYKHKEIVTEAIIGNMMRNTNQISQLFNALNGYTNDVDFEVGDEIICEDNYWGYVIEEGSDEPVQRHIPVGECFVKEIDLYRGNDKILVEFTALDREGVTKTRKEWVNHMKCSRVSLKKKS